MLELRGPFAVADALGTQVLALHGIAPSLRAAAILTQNRVFWRTGRVPESEKLLEQALTALDEAEVLRAEIGAGTDSALGHEVARLRAAIAARFG